MADPHLSDFNDIIVIATGLAMAYIFIETRSAEGGGSGQSSYSFINFLNRIISTSTRRMIAKRSEWLVSDQYVIAEAEFHFTQTKTLTPVQREYLGKLISKARDTEYRLNEVERKIDRFRHRFTRARYLRYAALDCFLFGLFLLFTGTLETRGVITEVASCVFVATIALSVFTLNCLMSEMAGKPRGWHVSVFPNYLIHGLLATAVFICCDCFCGHAVIPDSFPVSDRNVIEAVAVACCFSAFISYMALMLFLGFIIWWKTRAETKKLNLEKQTIKHQEEWNSIKTEIESMLPETAIDSSIGVVVNEIGTATKDVDPCGDNPSFEARTSAAIRKTKPDNADGKAPYGSVSISGYARKKMTSLPQKAQNVLKNARKKQNRNQTG